MKTVTGTKRQFEQRLIQRGATWESAAACIISDDGEMVTVDVDHPAYPRAPDQGLGDTVSPWLAKLGVRPRQECGCKKRQAWLNWVWPYRRGAAR